MQLVMSSVTESDVEEATLAWLNGFGLRTIHGPDIIPDSTNAERVNHGQVMLERRVRLAFRQLNPELPQRALDDVFLRLIRSDGATLETRNRAFNRMIVNGFTVVYPVPNGEIRGAQVRVIDFEHPDVNDWLAVNQFTVTENRNTCRPDVVLFVKGLPLGLIELKNPADEDATIGTAWNQLQIYKAELPTLFAMNEALVVSDGIEPRLGTLTAGWEWFKPWRTLGGHHLGAVPRTQRRAAPPKH